MKSISLAFASLALVTVTVLAAGCGKGNSGSGAPAGSGSAAAGGGDKTVLGSCNDPSISMCKEYYGAMSPFAADMCKGLEGKGVLSKGATGCAKENVVGTCEVKSDESSELWYYYKQPDITPEINKMACEIVGKWTPAKSAAAGGTGAGAPAGAGAHPGGGTKPAAAPGPAAAPAAPAKTAPPAKGKKK